MGILDRAKKLKEEAEQNARGARAGTGDRLKNKVRGDNRFGDQQAENEGANQQNSGEGDAHKTMRGGDRRDKFKKVHGGR